MNTELTSENANHNTIVPPDMSVEEYGLWLVVMRLLREGEVIHTTHSIARQFANTSHKTAKRIVRSLIDKETFVEVPTPGHHEYDGIVFCL